MRGILLDLDGTLIDSRATILRCLNTVLDARGAPLFTEGEITELIGSPLHDILALRIKDVERAAREYRDLQVATLHLDMKPFEGALGFLEWLHTRRLPAAVLTMRRTYVAKHILDRLDMSRLLSAILGEDDLQEGKPSPGAALAACQAIGVPPEDAVFVGDTRYDILCGKGVGCTTIGVLWGYGSMEELKDADILVGSFKDLESAIAGLTNKKKGGGINPDP
ncbi:MAG: HAD family hydrolase [Candidatus Thermoplasmatota archaeon]